jgi:PilZ domain
MYDHGNKKYDRDEYKSASAATKEAERRGGDRHLVIASAEVVELSSGARFATRTTDLGPGGCFVDTLTPFPVGSKVRVTVYKSNSHFETRGVVVYSQSGLGMGVAFDALEPKQRAALDAWLSELTQGKVSIPASKKPVSKLNEIASDRTALIRLVQLMISKGILTEAEGSSIFHDPLI